MKKFIVSVFVAGVASVTALSGCYLEARPATVDYSYGGWTPYYYNGNLVYFDSLGRPYYYGSGSMIYVPATWAHYAVATNAYRINGYRYRAWHSRYHRPTYYSRPVRYHRGYSRGTSRTYGRTYGRGHSRPVRHTPVRRTRYRR
jgi:hypothetical protein